MKDWTNLLGYCFDDYKSYIIDGRNKTPEEWVVYLKFRFLLFLCAFWVYLYIMFCFLYRKVTRGRVCDNSTQTLQLIVSICVFIYTLVWTTVSLFLIVGVDRESQVLLVLIGWEFGYVLEGTCPYFCTLLLATYRFFSICRPVFDFYRAISSRRLWISFLSYLTLTIILSVLKKLIGCHVFFSLNTTVYTLFALFWYAIVYCGAPLLGLMLITYFHARTSVRLHYSYKAEKQSLMANRSELMSLTESSGSSEHRAQIQRAEEMLLEEKKFLVSLHTYISVVTPALILRTSIVQVNELFLLLNGSYLFSQMPPWANIIEILIFVYIHFLFLLEFFFLLQINPSFGLFLRYPFRDLKLFFHRLTSKDPPSA